jgi:putative CocE/NonD family hydrolase
VVADQTMRGRFRSGGEGFYLYGRQQFDGADAVEWLARQPWSTGEVGTYGVSHAGVAQYHSPLRIEGLAAMVPAFAKSNFALVDARAARSNCVLNWATGASAVIDDRYCRRRAFARSSANTSGNLPFFFPFAKARRHSALRRRRTGCSRLSRQRVSGRRPVLQDPDSISRHRLADAPLHHSAW